MIWYIAFGSALGGAARYLFGGWIQDRAGAGFPVGTLVINVTGSFLLGLLYRYAADSAAITPEVRAMLTIGICGGYTTFSTFSYETVRLLEEGEFGRAGLYIALSILLSVAAAFLGLMAGRELVALRRG
jgi:CrcB protein